jgi:hypothetical protein
MYLFARACIFKNPPSVLKHSNTRRQAPHLDAKFGWKLVTKRFPANWPTKLLIFRPADHGRSVCVYVCVSTKKGMVNYVGEFFLLQYDFESDLNRLA